MATVTKQKTPVVLQIETTSDLHTALKAGVAVSGKYKSMRDYVETCIRRDFKQFLEN